MSISENSITTEQRDILTGERVILMIQAEEETEAIISKNLLTTRLDAHYYRTDSPALHFAVQERYMRNELDDVNSSLDQAQARLRISTKRGLAQRIIDGIRYESIDKLRMKKMAWLAAKEEVTSKRNEELQGLLAQMGPTEREIAQARIDLIEAAVGNLFMIVQFSYDRKPTPGQLRRIDKELLDEWAAPWRSKLLAAVNSTSL